MQLNTLDNIFGTTKKDDKKTATQPVNVSSSKSRVSTLDNIFEVPKTDTQIVETPKTPEIKPEKQEYLSQGKEDTRKEDTVLTRIGRAILPHFLEKELGISEEQRKTTLTRAETIKMQGMETTKYLANKNPEKVSPLEYLKRGISFGNELDPTDYLRGYKSDVSVEDLPEPVTAPQKISQAIGNILTMSLAQPLIESAFVGVVSKVPAGAKLLETVQTASKINPWTIGYGVDVAKAGATGGLFGLITENKQSVAKNVAETAGMFAAFSALTFPILQFFKPIISSVGKMDIQNPKIRNILNDPSATESTITKTLWFKNPKDPNQLLKVTANGMEYVSGKGKEIVEKGVYVKDIPTLTSVDIEAFQVKPSIYENLKTWIGGKLPKNVKFKVSDVTPTQSGISGTKVNTDITSSELRLQAEKLMTKAKSGDSSILDELAGTQSAIRQFETSTKTTPIIVSGADDKVLATISTVEYSDGKFTIEINADAGSVGFNQGFASSKIYNSEDEAIKAGNKMILDWAKTQEKYVEGEDKNLLQTIKDSLDADTPYVINKPMPYDITAKGTSLVEFGKEAEKYKTPKEFEDAISTMESDKDFENIVQFHGTQKGDDLIKAIESGSVKASEQGLLGKGFYLTSSKEAAQMFGKQVYDPSKQARTGVSNEPTVISIDVTELNIKELDYGKSDYYEFLDDKNLTPDQYNQQLISEGYDGLNLKGRGETIIFDPSKVKVFDFNQFYSEATGKEIEPEKPKKAIIDKAKIEKLETELKDAYKKYPDAEKELETILVKMELAEAGKRVFTGYGSDREVIGVSSTFPQWIPENLRTKKSLDALREVIKNVDSLTYPSKVNATAKRLLVNEMLNELDSKLGIDTMEIRNDILKEYGQIEKSDVGDVGGGKQGRGEPTGERAKIEGAKKQDIQDEIERLKLEVETKEDFDGALSPEKITEKQNRIKELEAQLGEPKTQKEIVKEEFTGEELLSKIKDSGVSITPSIKTEIKNQSFKLEKVSIDKVLKDDPDAKDFVDNFKGTNATKKTEPIIIGKWQGKDNSVMDGYHRLGAIKNSGNTEIEAYVSLVKPSIQEKAPIGKAEITTIKAKEAKDIYTKDEISELNNNSYYNVDWNEDFKNTITSIKNKVNLNKIPDELVSTWNTFLDKYTELYKKDLRIRADNPSPSVTGRSGYNFAKRDKSVARNRAIMDQKEELVNKLDKDVRSYKFQTERSRKSEMSEVDLLKEKLVKEQERLAYAKTRPNDKHFIDFFTKKVNALERKISKLESGEKPSIFKKETQTEKYTREMKEESISKGSGFASMDKFRETMKPIEENIEKVNPVEFPELVKLARELMGEFPKVKLPRFRPSMGGRPYGVFYPVGDGKIVLNPELFIQGNEEQAAKTLAHEIGHLLDYLPDKTMARGNILGRLAVLKKFGKEFYPEIGLTRSNKEMKRELWELSKYWKPVNEATASEGYLSYRKSPEEIYADFISVLLNDPKLAQDKAPEAYNVFFKTLDKKPEVKQAYFELQDLLAGTSEDLMKARQEDIRKGFERGEDLQAQFSAKKKLAKAHFWERLRQQLDDVNYPIIKKLREAEANGKIISEEDNPRFLLQEQSLVDNENYLLIDKVDKDIVKPLEKAGVIIEDIGEYLLLDRIINERVNIANPFGFNTKNAPKQLEFLQKTIGDKNFELLKEKVTLFHNLVFQSVEEAVKVGSYNKELFETKIKPNKEFYASFQVVDYMQDYIPATVKGQTGTLKEVANPFVSTILKTIALNRLNAFQRAKNATIKLLKGAGEGEIAKSKTITTDGKLTIFKVARDRGGLEVLEDGKMTSYDVDPYIADSFKRDKIGDLNMIVSLLDKFNNKLFKPLVTTYNLGFAAAFNPIRDFKRNYKMIPNATILSLLKAYGSSLKSAVKYSKGELDEFTKSLVESKAIIAPVNEYNFDPRDDELGNTLKKYGLIKEYQPYDNKAIEFIRKTLLKPVVKTLEGIRFIANTFEIVSKIGGAKVRIAGGESGKQLSYNLRNYTGTPNWKVKGKQTNTTNAIFVFSNIMKEGIKSDFQVATDPKTRAGYWWKTTKIDLLPKFLMFLASAGALGAGLKKFYDKVSEYDKANYIIIPLGITDEKKAVYMRIPHDETGRMISAIFWKMASFIKDKGNTKDLSDIFAVGAGQLPSVTPIITALGGWTQYLSGRNPYDSFRGRTVIDDTTWEAGGGASLKKMVQWTTNTLGVSSFATYDTHKNTGLETFMQTAPFFNRLFKISNYGETEQLREVKSEVKKEVAQRTLKEREIVEKYVQEATKDGKPSMFYMTKFANKAIKDALGGHMPRNDEEKKTADRIEKKFKVLIKKELNNDPRILSLIDAVSSDEKKAILKEIKKDMSSEEWSKIRTLLLKDKIVTEVIIYNIK